MVHRASAHKEYFRTLIVGQGLSGVTAAFAALAAPERFGKVLAQSIALWWSPEHRTCPTSFDPHHTWLTTALQRAAPMPVAFYIEVGGAEGLVTVANRRLRDLLDAKGYALTYHEVNSVAKSGDRLAELVRGLTALGVEPEPFGTAGVLPPLKLDAKLGSVCGCSRLSISFRPGWPLLIMRCPPGRLAWVH